MLANATADPSEGRQGADYRICTTGPHLAHCVQSASTFNEKNFTNWDPKGVSDFEGKG